MRKVVLTFLLALTVFSMVSVANARDKAVLPGYGDGAEWPVFETSYPGDGSAEWPVFE